MVSAVDHIRNFVNWVNDGVEVITDSEIAQLYADEVKESFERQFCSVSKGSGDSIRMSGLGKPAVLQAMKVLGYEESNTFDMTMRHRFHIGDSFEAYLMALAKFYFPGRVRGSQDTVEYMGIKGHLDGIIDTPDGSVVIEAKSMTERYFMKFLKTQDDERGYATQAALYSHCTGLPLVWVCLNKATHRVEMIELQPEDGLKALLRAERLIPMLKSLKHFGDIWDCGMMAPPPTAEIYQRKETGMKLVPESMRYSSFIDVFYYTEMMEDGYHKIKTYVVSPIHKTFGDAVGILQEMGYEIK